jgi:flavin-dependent dehydrogenase
VGAGGHRCPVAKALGEVSEREEVVIAQESETRVPPERLRALRAFMDAPELYVERDLKGYGWYFPKEDVLNIGIGVVSGPGADLPRRRESLLAALHASGQLPPDLPIEPFRGHAYVVRRRAPRRLSGDRFCLVGDAAGLARDLSGEGIGPAIRSGLLAAEAVEAHLRRGAALASYGAEIVRRYGSGEESWVGRQLGRLPHAVARAFVRAVLGVGVTRRRVVFGTIFGMREVPA